MRCNTDRSRAGVVMVEFAVLLPAYIFILLMVFYVGNALLVKFDLRASSRAFAESRGGWPLAENIQDVFDTGYYNMLIGGFYQAENLDLHDEGGWGGGDGMDTDLVEATESVPVDDSLSWDVARALRANNRFDYDRGYNIGSHFGRYGVNAECDVAMVEHSQGAGSNFEDYATVFWQWDTIAGHYNHARGGGPGFAARLDEGTPYRHLMEVNITNYELESNWGYFDPGPDNGRMPYDKYRQLCPSDYVVSPRHQNFPPPEVAPPYSD